MHQTIPIAPGVIKQQNLLKKTWQVFYVLIRSFAALYVESEGFEPSSKQVIKQLSTRLVFY